MKKLLLTLTLLIGFNNEVLAQSKGDYVVQGRVPNAVLINEDNSGDENPIIVPQNPEASRLWLNFFQENGQLEAFNALLDWETIDDTAIVSDLGIKSSTNNEEEVAVPQGNLGIRSIYNLDFSNNELRNVDFLVSLEEIRGNVDFRNNNISNLNGMYFVQNINGNAYFDNNQINSINNLLNLTTIGGELTLHNNPNLTSLYGLKSITSGTIRLDDPVQYTKKVDFYSDFCQQFNDGNIFVYLQDTSTQITKAEVCEADPWLTFFQENGQLSSFNQMIEWEDNNDFTTANLENAGFNNFDLPAGDLGVNSLYRLDFNNNELTTLNFMENVTEVRDSLVFNGNFIRDVTKLSGLTVVEGDINLANNSLRRLDGLENVTNIDRLFINNNPLTELTPIENLFNVNEIYIDEANQYQKLDFSTPLCNSFINGVADFVVQSTGLSAEVSDICDNVPQFSEWLNYFQSKGQLTDFNNIFDWIVFDDFADLSNQNIDYSEFINLPTTIGVYSVFGLDISQNNMRVIDFLGSVREIRTNLYLQSNDLRNITGLSQLESVVLLDISKNNNLKDIRGLLNLSQAERVIFDNPNQYNLKPDYTSNFCQGLASENIVATNVGGDKLSPLDLCINIPDDEQWLLFFKVNNQFKSYDNLSAWQSSEEIVRINKNYFNSDLPNVNIPLTTIYTFDLSNNQLNNINFMSVINELRGDLILRNNKINDLNGLSNIITAKKINLSDNELTTLSGINIVEMENLDISNNQNLVDISNLENIQKISEVIIDNPAQYTNKPNINSVFCGNVETGITKISRKNSTIPVSSNEICSGVKSAQDAWLFFFKNNKQLLSLENLNDWGDSEESAILDNQLLNNNKVPAYNMGLSELYTLDFSGNSFDNVNFLNGLNKVNGDLLLDNNVINSLLPLSGLTEVEGTLNIASNSLSRNIEQLSSLSKVKELIIYDNPLLEYIGGIRNIEGNTVEDPVIIRMSNPNLYASNWAYNRRKSQNPEAKIMPKMSYYDPLCFGLIKNTIVAYIGNSNSKAYISGICDGVPNDAKWLEFYQSFNQLTTFSFLSDWKNQDQEANVSSQNLSNQDLPTGTMGIDSIYTLIFANNNLTNVDFLAFTEFVRGDLDLSNNNITSLNGLNLIKVVTGELRLQGNDYNSLKDISGITNASAIRIDNPNEFEKLSYSTPICQAIENGQVTIYIEEETTPLPLSRVCFTADTDPNTAWLNFFKVNGQLTNFNNLSDWESNPNKADVSTLNLTNADIPNSLMRINSLDSLDFSDNNLANAFFLNNITRVRGELDLSNNNLSNIGAVSNLKSAKILKLNGNDNVNSLLDLEFLTYAEQLVIDEPSQYTFKPETTTNFCQAIKSLSVNVFDINRKLGMKDVCSNVSSEDEWLSFFQSEHNTLNNLNSLSQWLLKNEVGAINDPKGLLNNNLPDSNLPLSSIYTLEITNQELDNLNFMQEVNTVRGSLNFNNNKISEINGLSTLNGFVENLILSNNNITEVNALNNNNFNNLNLSNNLLINVEGLNITNINDLYLNNNNINDINALLTLNSVSGVLKLNNNNDLSDITGISNVNIGKIELDSVNQYTIRPDFTAPFCQGILANTVNVEDIINNKKVYVEEICENVSDKGLWLSFFHKKGELLKLSNLDQWLSIDEVANINNKNISNADLPSSTINLSSLFTLNASNNNLTEVGFLLGLEEVRGDLLLNGNPLANLNGLEDLEEVTGIINLSNTGITDTTQLSNLRRVGRLDLSGNPNIIDLSGIENIEKGLEIYLNEPTQYELIDFTSPFCFEMSRGLVVPIVKSTSRRIYITEICNGVPNDAKWLNYLQSQGQLIGFTDLSDWERNDVTATMASKSLTVGDIPSARMPTTQIYSLNFSNNLLSNISFLNLVEVVREELNFNNNRINNIAGLGRLQKIKNLKLSNNDIESLDRMEEINEINYLNLSYNPNLDDISILRNVSGTLELRINNTAIPTLVPIENFNSLIYLDISNTPLNDISPLANLTPNTVIMKNPLELEIKPDFNSQFCQAYYNKLINVTYNGSDVYYVDICSNVPAHIAWLDFFNKENQLTNFATFDKWLNTNTTANISARNLINNRLPQQTFELSSIYDLDISYNNLENVSFLNGVATIRNNLNLEGNDLIDFTGLDTLVSINDLTVSNNPMVEFAPQELNSVNNLEINNNASLETISLPKLSTLTGNLLIENNPLLTTLENPLLTTIGGDVSINNTSLSNMNINGVDFQGALSIENNTGLTNFIQDSIAGIELDYTLNNNAFTNAIIGGGNINRSLIIENNQGLEDITINTINNLGRFLQITSNPDLTNIYIDNILNQGDNYGIIVRNNNLLKDFTINNMRYIKSSLDIYQNNSLENITLNNIERAYGELRMYNMPSLKSVNIGTINTINGDLLLYDNPLLESVIIDNIGNIEGSIVANNNDSLKTFNVSTGVSNIDFDLDLSNNLLLNTVDLGTVNRIDRDFLLNNNPKLNNLTGLANLAYVNPTRRNFAIDEPTQYTILPDYNTSFCIGITASDIIPEYNNDFVSITNLCNNVPNHALWMDIFHSYEQMRDADTIFDWELTNNTSKVDLSGNSLSENDFPSFPIDASKLYMFDISDNNFTQLDILRNLTEVRESFYAQNNLINDISSITKITRIENNFDLSNNRLISLDGFLNLNYVGNEISMHTNPSLTDISGLSNLTYAQRVEFDSPEQYLTIMEATSPFCQAVATQDIKVFIGDSNNKIAMGYLCNNADDQDLWLNLFHTYNQLPSYTEISDWETNNGIGDLSSKGFNDNQLPESPMATTSVYDLLMNNNNISNVDFMSNVTNVRRTLNFSDNQINRITGLSNITNYVNLYLQNNSISEISPLDNIQTGLVNIDLSYNELTRVPNLTNFAGLTNVYFNNNINLEDISGLTGLRNVDKLYLNNTAISNINDLENLVSANEIRFDDPNNYAPKLDYLTPFCDGIKNDIILPYYTGNLIDIRDLCNNFSDDYLWLLFFRDNGQLLTYNDISEWQTKAGIAKVTGLSLENSDLPPNLIGVTSLYTLNLSDNFIQNVNFLSDVTTIRETLNLNDNALTDISGLSNITNAQRILLANNPNIVDINSLSQLTTIVDLDLRNTGRVSLEGLTNLTTITGTLDLRNNANLVDISLFNQFTSANAIEIDEPSQYTKLVYDENIVCERINNGVVKLYNNGDRQQANAICSDAPSEFAWLDFLKAFNLNSDFDSYYSLQQWKTNDSIADLNNLGLANENLPEGNLGVDSIYSIILNNNNLNNIDFLSGVSTIRDKISLHSNQLVNIDPLVSVTNINNGDVFLYDNLLENVDGLINLGRFGGEHEPKSESAGTWTGRPGADIYSINLRRNNLKNVNGLINLTEMTYADLFLDQNPTLTDITGLSNLASVTYFNHNHCANLNCATFNQNHHHWVYLDDYEQYTNKPLSGTPFCNAVKTGAVRLQASGERLALARVCNVENEWFQLFHDYNQVLWNIDLNDLVTQDLNIDLSGNGLGNEDLPLISLGVNTFYNISLANNTLTDIEFLSDVIVIRNNLDVSGNQLTTLNGLRNVTTVNNLDLSNNNLTTFEGLDSLTTVNGTVYLNENENVDDLRNISNITNTNNNYIYIDKPNQYINKPDSSSPFCQAASAGDVLVRTTERVVSYLEICDASALWLQFLQDNGQALDINELSELNNQTTPIDLSNNAFTDTDIPDGTLSIGNLLNFDISNNNITSVFFLVGLTNINEELNLSNNALTSINGLGSLENVQGDLLLNNNNIVTLTELENINYIGGDFDISGNSPLVDISKIGDLSTLLGKLYIDEPTQYITKPDVTTPFCINVANDNIIIEVKATTRQVDVNEICSSTNEWLQYFFEQEVMLDNLELSDWITENIDADLSSRGIVSSDLPQVDINLPEIYNFDLSENEITHIDFMNDITSVNEVDFSYNNLSNITGIEELTNVNQELKINGNNNVEDLTPISKISNAVIYINNPSQYTNKPNISTPLCEAILATEVRPEDLLEGEVILKAGEVCSSTNPWMTYFYDNKVMLDYGYITDMETNDITIDLSNNAIDNSLIPTSNWNVLSIYNVNLKNNNLSHINFLGGVSEIRDRLDVSLNNLNNINGLFSLTTAGDIFLNGNNLVDISGLINLSELKGYLYLTSNPNLTDITYLENLQVNNPSFPVYLDDPSQYTRKPAVGSNFCQAVDSGSLTVVNADTSQTLTSSEICE